jgi:hypothetical protein
MNETPVTTVESGALAAPSDSRSDAVSLVAAPTADAAPTVVAPAMPDLFGKPPLLASEDANLYDAILSRAVVAARPRDPFEWMLLKDYVDLSWEIFRLRRAKAGYVNGMQRSALIQVLHKLHLDVLAARKWHSDPDVKTSTLRQLAEWGLGEDIIAHEAVMICRGEIASLDAMIASTEHRRNAMLREIDYHRAGLATRLRAAPDVVDAEIEDAPIAASAEARPPG